MAESKLLRRGPRRLELRGFFQSSAFSWGIFFLLSMRSPLPRSGVDPFVALLCIISCKEP